MPDAAVIRDSLRAARAALQKNYGPRSRPAYLLRAHARLVDEHLRLIWRELAMPPELALAATGGYGRGELYPKSDIDLLILLPREPDEALQQRLHELVQMLWDSGLEVGHSVRTVAQCLAESADLTVQTNLLEARLVAGAHALYEEMRDALGQHLDRRAFYLAKVQEQEKRYTRFLDTDYNLEPNLKESPGGLRDLQNVLWISRACGFGEYLEGVDQRTHDHRCGSFSNRAPRSAVAIPAHSPSFPGAAPRRPPAVRLPDGTGRAIRHRCHRHAPCQRTPDAALLPHQAGRTATEFRAAAKHACTPVSRVR